MVLSYNKPEFFPPSKTVFNVVPLWNSYSTIYFIRSVFSCLPHTKMNIHQEPYHFEYLFLDLSTNGSRLPSPLSPY